MSESTDPLATCPKCRRCAEWCGCTFTEEEIKAMTPPVADDLIQGFKEFVEDLESGELPEGKYRVTRVVRQRCIMATDSEDYLAYPCGVAGCTVHGNGDE